MNTRLINRRSMCTALAFVFAGTAACAHAATMSVDARAPIQATLLPEVTVFASSARPEAASTMRVAATKPLNVTLLPTVRVNQRVSEGLAMVTLPTVRVVAQAEDAMDGALAYQSEHASRLPDVDAANTMAPIGGARAGLMPQ